MSHFNFSEIRPPNSKQMLIVIYFSFLIEKKNHRALNPMKKRATSTSFFAYKNKKS